MRRLSILLITFLYFTSIEAQVNNITAGIESQAIVTSKDVPFWMQSNQFGSIPLAGVSASFIGQTSREYDTARRSLLDWGFGIEGRMNVGKKAELLLIEGYGKVRFGIFEAKAGRSKDVLGLIDTSLSSGSIAISGNALGVPKVQIAVPEFYSLPILGKIFAFKGNFAHGWLGEVPIHYNANNTYSAKTYLHQSSFYGRFGKPEWKLKLIGGITHQVFWGNDSSIFGAQFPYSDWHAFPYVVTGKKYLGVADISKVGNHLGSIDVGFELATKKLRILAYRQHFYDKGAIYRMANLLDGLNGISIINKKQKFAKTGWNKILFEVLYTKNQGADKWTPSGPEYYYNHEVYAEGYTYKQRSLGTPFFSNRAYIKTDLPSIPRDYFINNRIFLLHFGIEGTVKNWNITSKISYSKNHGTYGTSSARTLHTINGVQYQHVPVFGVFPETRQLSTYFEVGRELKNGLRIGCVTAFDRGQLYNNTFGMLVKLSKAL